MLQNSCQKSEARRYGDIFILLNSNKRTIYINFYNKYFKKIEPFDITFQKPTQLTNDEIFSKLVNVYIKGENLKVPVRHYNYGILTELIEKHISNNFAKTCDKLVSIKEVPYDLLLKTKIRIEEILDVEFSEENKPVIKYMALYGSRATEGKANTTPTSDIDILLEYSGDIKEDDFFNLLHNSNNLFKYNGFLSIDINPVKSDIFEHLKKWEKYKKLK